MSWTATRHDGNWTAPGLRRAGWRPLELAAMIAGFVFFWPVGLAILAWKGWKEGWWMASCASRSERREARRERWAGQSGGSSRGGFPGGGWSRGELRRDSGNSAFEDYKDDELRRLQAEYDRLVEEQRSFGAFIDDLRRAKDKAEFDQFLASRRGPSPGTPAPDAPVGPAA